MAQYVLVPPELWLEWLEDEADLEDWGEYEKLWNEAIGHYSHVSIWSHRLARECKSILDEDGDLITDKVEPLRELCERAVAAVGRFVFGGSDIWKIYRFLENTILSTSMDTIDDEAEVDDNDVSTSTAEQIGRIKKLYERQLSVPLLDVSDTYNEYNEWHTKLFGSVNAAQKQPYLKVKKYVAKVKESEAALIEDEEADLELWMQYINQEIVSQASPPVVQSLFERALNDFPRDSNLWQEYTAFALKNQLVEKMQICGRAVKALPQAGELWARAMQAAPGLDALWEVCRRAKPTTGRADLVISRVNGLRENPEKARAAMAEGVKFVRDSPMAEHARLFRFWAQVECYVFKDAGKTRGAFNQLLKVDKTLPTWRDAIAAMRHLGEINPARSLFKRCIYAMVKMEDFEDAAEDWKAFELLHGSGESYFGAVERVSFQRRKLEEAEEKRKAQAAKNKKSKKRKREEEDLERKKKARKAQESQAAVKKSAPAADAQRSGDAPPGFEAPAGKPAAGDLPPGFESAKQGDLPPGFESAAKGDLPPGFEAPTDAPPGFHAPAVAEGAAGDAPSKPKAAQQGDKPPGFEIPPSTAPTPPSTEPMEVEDDQIQTKMESRTLFVLNIPKALKYEQELQKLAAEFGAVKSLRCIRGKKGKILKGFAYVEFETVEEKKKAQAGMQGKQLGKKTLQVQNYRKKDGSNDKTLYVRGIKNLPDPVGDLKALFGSCGPIEEVRVAFDNNMRNKGFAFVQFSTSKSVEKAMEIPQPTIKGYTLRVQRYQNKEKKEKQPKQFIPRTLNRKKKTQLGAMENQEEQDTPAEDSGSKNLSNAQFRQFLN